jgi:hypothetical protein
VVHYLRSEFGVSPDDKVQGIVETCLRNSAHAHCVLQAGTPAAEVISHADPNLGLSLENYRTACNLLRRFQGYYHVRTPLFPMMIFSFSRHIRLL